MQRLRVRYAKRGRLRFTSHRDISRAVERAVRRAGIPVAYSAGFTPHPKISYAGAAPTGVASEAEYLEIGVSEPCQPQRVRDGLNGSLPPGVDVLDVVAAGPGALADRLEASAWEIRVEGVSRDAVESAVAAFLRADLIEVERMTKKGLRRFDTRAAVVTMTVTDHGSIFMGPPGLAGVADAYQRVAGHQAEEYAILRIVVRHGTPAVRPDDVLTALRQVGNLAPPSPSTVTRLAQGPLDAMTDRVDDPLASDREAERSGRVPSGDVAVTT